MTLSSAITDFLEYLEIERNTSQKTIENYDHYLKRFLDFAGDISPTAIDLSLIRKYRLHLGRWTDPKTKQPLKRITQNYFMIALRAFLRYLARQDVKTLSPEKVELGEAEARPLKVLDEAALKSLLEAPDITDKSGTRDKAILELLFSTGLRVSEMASLNRDSINLSRREFSVVGKGQKERIVFLSDSAADCLERYLDARKDTFKPLFIRFQGKVDLADNGAAMRLTPRSIEKSIQKYALLAGLPSNTTPHVLRHSFATDMLSQGVDIRILQEFLGHKSITATQIYAHVTSKKLREIHRQFHGGQHLKK